MIKLFEEYKKYNVGDYIKISSIVNSDGLYKLYGLIINIEEYIYDIKFINTHDKTLGKTWLHNDEIERLLTPNEKEEMEMYLQTNKYNI